MLETGIDDFFDAVKLGAPEVAHFLEELTDSSEALVQAPCHDFEFDIKVSHQQAEENGIEQHRSPDDNVDLFVCQLFITSAY
jgi:hypothetical protein